MLKEFWLLLKPCDIFSIFTAAKVESKVLVSLGLLTQLLEIEEKRGRW